MKNICGMEKGLRYQGDIQLVMHENTTRPTKNMIW